VLVPTQITGNALGTTWREREFDDSTWQSGTLAVGFKAGGSDPVGLRGIIQTDLQSQMYNQPNRLSVYLRIPFEIVSPEAVVDLELRTRFDDGYAAFLNGGTSPVDQVNAPSNLAWNSASTATVFDSDGLPPRTAGLRTHRNRLVNGTNILAVHGLNVNQTSSDLLVAPELWARLATPSEPGRLGYFSTPTPGTANLGNDELILAETVTFSQPPQAFTGSMSVELSGAAENQTIRYTTNGSVPTASSAAYNGPLPLNSTTLIRARVFDQAGTGGRTNSAHYLRISTALANRRSNLPMVVMDARGQGLNSSTRRDGYFHLFDRDADGISALARPSDVSTRHGIRYRGSSSEGQPKRPYSVEFWDETDDNRRLEVLGMTAESDWIFYAPYHFDRTYTRNSIAYEMSRRIGRWAPNTRFVEVFYNDNGGELVEADYVGVYAIVEQVKMNSRRLGHRLVEPTDVPPPGVIDPLAPGRWTGGYLFKIDRTDPDEYNWRTNRNIPGEWLTLNRPKLPNLDGGPYFSNAAALAGSRQVAYLREYVQQFEDALAADRAANFATRNYLRFIDRDSWIDHLIINAFTKNVDALRLSAFFHKPENETLRAGPVWDFDRSMGSYDGRDSSFSGWNGTGDATRYFEFIWWGWLCEDPDFAQAFYDRWAELRQDALSPAGLENIVVPFGDEIDNTANGLGSAAARDAARWSSNSPRSGQYSAETQHILNWLKSRASWMDRRAFDEALRPPPPTIVTDGDLATLNGSDIYFTLDGRDPRASGGSPAGPRYTGPIDISGPTVITARSLIGGAWSTPMIATFNIAPPAPTFLPDGTADWTLAANWSTAPAPYPDGPGSHAIITPPGGGNRNVDLTAPVTVGRIAFPQLDSSDRNRIRGELPGNTLTFANGDLPARIEVGGTGTGFVEFEVVGGTMLDSTLELDVTNLVGDPEHGALRLRQMWNGPGGLTKRGAGMASLTGEDKVFTGPTRIEEGVLQITEPSTMTGSASITVMPGGQLRLISGSGPALPRVHTFGGDLSLSGFGRGDEIPDSAGLGRLGALRYQPGGDENLAIITNPVELVDDGSIHVAGAGNQLELAGALRGTGALSKSGGGTLALTGDSPEFVAPIRVETGQLLLRGSLGSAIELAEIATLDAAGESGPIHGNGALILPATTLITSSVSALRHSMVFTQPGPPDLTDLANSGNALLIASEVETPSRLDLYLDLAQPPTTETLVQGGFLLPADASWSAILNLSGTRIFVADPLGDHEFRNQTWSENTSAQLSAVRIVLTSAEGTHEGKILQIRFSESPFTYESWRHSVFRSEDALDDAISGPEAAPFGDGIANLLRFALDLGFEDAAGFLPVVSMEQDAAVFSFRYHPHLEGLRWIVEATSDLKDWSDAGILFDSFLDPALPDSDGWLDVKEPIVSEKRFYRLRVTAE
jgi:autotransporter-associated beta strand protein